MNHHYRREDAIRYAHQWAFRRNPRFADFEEMGGDCTNFTSQCLLAGGIPMKVAENGWYYHSLNDRAPAWSGVEPFARFALSAQSGGPQAVLVSAEEAIPGDLVQMNTVGSRFHHAAIIVERRTDGKPLENLLVACHSYDSDYRPLSTYSIREIRFLHILDG